MIIIILVVCLFQFVYGIPRIVDQGVRDQLIRHCFDIGYSFNEIIAYLLCKHRIAVSLPQLKHILRRMGLLKKKQQHQTCNLNRPENYESSSKKVSSFFDTESCGHS